MSEIINTEAIVLSKLNYGETSSIVSLYTKDCGKLSVIIKGGRNPKSKIGFTADPINYIQTVFYKKDSRELQILKSADIISYYPNIKKDLEKLKYTYAVLELIKKLTVEYETNLKLFKGLTRILELFDSSNENPKVLFGRFFIFFLTELGYEIQLDKCSVCGQSNLQNMDLSYKLNLGILCNNCRNNYNDSFPLSEELFRFMVCLKHNKNTNDFRDFTAERAIIFMEKYLRYHVSDFREIQSFKSLK